MKKIQNNHTFRPPRPGMLSPTIPAQPPESAWKFTQELRQPLHNAPIIWERRTPRAGEVDLRKGVTLDFLFPDPHGNLATMHADFRRFLKMASIPIGGAYRIATEQIKTRRPESFTLDVTSAQCRILAGDTEGIRRGLIFLEDELLRNAGPFLKPGKIQRTPVIRSRISRCFFGPIKRPPKNRDELMDTVDYYPDEYLNRLAHDGVNGLWLTVEWKDLAPTDLFPDAGQNAARRLAKLNRTIAKCARYGIKIYIFCIEPAAIPADSPALSKYPELAGHRQSGRVYFCVSNKRGRAYVENATRRIFQVAPGLGGMIVISVGERATHCYSATVQTNCPRCSRRKPREVLADVLAAMERGMHAVNPAAELISWPYTQYISWGEARTVDAAGHVPQNVILQHNFESGGRARQLGRERYLGDYWLSYVGPSQLYQSCARQAVAHGTRMSAKLQVGCSHETATAPFVPVPGNLYGKYRAMHQLGVSAAMYGWYFGTYPSLMTRAAGELAFVPFPKTEKAFLLHLAQRDWGRHAARVAAAWKCFQTGYRQFPYSGWAGYYGPFHDGPVWPLYPIPRDLPLTPTWRIDYGVSGDRIGEMICYTHTAAEFQTLLTRMSAHWQRGCKLLAPLRKIYRDRPEHLRDLSVAEALNIKFESSKNILDFYLLREDLPFQTSARQLRTLRAMRKIMRREMELSRRLLALTRDDSRLGFHSEAEGYKYYPQLIEWRIQQLRELSRKEFPQIQKTIRDRQPLFPGYAAPRPGETVYECRHLRRKPAMNGRPVGAVWDALPAMTCDLVMSPH
ncbi:MAG: hypothetical protein ACOYCD_08455, partial [Kiritimatiellia bacterium]